jgi:dTDP-4-dehydrorhamnose 3,5-epimerase
MQFLPTRLEGSTSARTSEAFLLESSASGNSPKRGSKPVSMQINNSLSRDRGTLRGMHYQLGEAAEVKLVRCVRGALWDVILDLRPAALYLDCLYP